MGRGKLNWEKVAWEKKIRDQGFEVAFEANRPASETITKVTPTPSSELVVGRAKALATVTSREKRELALLRELVELWMAADVAERERSFIAFRIRTLEKRLNPFPNVKAKPEKKKTPVDQAQKVEKKKKRQERKELAKQRVSEKARGSNAIVEALNAHPGSKKQRLQAAAEKRKNDPLHIARLEERRRQEQERMSRIVVEVKKQPARRSHLSSSSD